MTTIYIAMVDDRHVDPEPHPFSTADAAIAYAKAACDEYAWHPEDIEEEPIDGWLYYARYGEDSSVWVVAKQLDHPQATVDGGQS